MQFWSTYCELRFRQDRYALMSPRRHRPEWLLRGLFVEMTSWLQCAMP